MKPLEDTLMSTLHDAVLSYPQGGAKAVASKLGKGYTTLLREVNPFDKGAKLGVITFAQLIQTTGDPAPLRLLADACGFDLVPRPDAPDPDHAD